MKMCCVKMLPDGDLDNEEPVRLTDSKADRSTIQEHRTDENNEEQADLQRAEDLQRE